MRTASDSRPRSRLWLAASLVALLSLVAAACGDDDDAETPDAPSEPAATDSGAAEPDDSEETPEPETTEAPGEPAPDEPKTTEAPAPQQTEAPDEPEPVETEEPQEPAAPSGEPVRIGILFSNSGPAGIFGPPRPTSPR